MAEAENKDGAKEIIERARELPDPGRGFDFKPRNFDEAYRFANFISNSNLIPAAFRGKPADVLIAVQLAMELGVAPMQGLQSIAVINGRPTIWGDLLPALVYQSGLCDLFNEEGDENEARCTVKRKGFAPIQRTFSMEDARRVPYTEANNPKVKCLADKATYVAYPKRMLQMRARAFAIRDAFPDVLKGVGIREETEDIPTTAVDVTPPYDRIAPPQRRSEQKETTDEPIRSAATEPEAQETRQVHEEKAPTEQTKAAPGDSGTVPEKEPEKEKVTLEAIIDWIEKQTDVTELAPPNLATMNLKGRSDEEQLKITSALNTKRVALQKAAKDEKAKG